MELRHLALNNTDTKHVCRLVAVGMSPVLQKHIHGSKRGFVRGRNMLQNVLDFHTESRINAFRCSRFRGNAPFSLFVPAEHVGKLAVATLFDYVAAFPRVLQHWLFACLKCIGFPAGGLMAIIRNRYRKCSAFLLRDGCESWLFEVHSGVLQGCPRNAVLFLVAIDPLLWLSSTTVVKKQLCTVTACADDIAITLRHLELLASAFKILFISR